MDIKDLLGNVPFNFQELNLPTPLNQSSIDAIENEEYDMSQHKVKGWQIFNPFAGAKAVNDARKGKKKFEEEKQRRLQEEQEKGNAMTMGLNALSAMIQGNQQEQQYNSIPPDNLTPVQGSFGFSHGGSINQPFYGKSGFLDKVAQETMQDIDSEPATTKKGAKEKMKRAESLDLYSRTSAIKGPNGLENNPYFNKTGYTPGTESMNNPYNIIPGQEITMENTPFPVQGIPINEFGEPVGEPIMMEPGGFYRFPNAFGVLELPDMQAGGDVQKKENIGSSETMSNLFHNMSSYFFGTKHPNLEKSKYNPTKSSNKNAEYHTYKNLKHDVMSDLLSDTNIENKNNQQKKFKENKKNYKPYFIKEKSFDEFYTYLSNDQISNSKKRKFQGSSINLGQFSVSPGKDERGRYLAIYDKYDWNMFENMGFNGNSFEIYDRIYEDEWSELKKMKNTKKYQMGGPVQNEMSPVQTEVGEMITTPDMTTTKTLATKRHSQMTDDEVTDVLPVGSMIWSNDPQMAFTRNEYIAGRKLEDMVIGTTPMYYSETEPMLPQEDIKLLDGFTKKGRFTPADFAKSIKRRMPITDRTHDAFSELAKRENRAHRAEYLIPFAEISMYKKDAVDITEGLDQQEPKPKFQMGGAILGSGGAGMKKLMQRTYGMAPENQQPLNPLQAMMSKRDNAAKAYDPNTFSQSALGGMMKNLGGIGTISPITSFNFGSMFNFKPQKAQFSEVAQAAAAGGGADPISAIAGFATGLMDFGLGIYDRATNAKRYKQTIKEIKQAELDNRANIDNAANIGAAGTLANYALQDPSYTYLNLDDVISSNETAYSDALKRIAAERQATMLMNQASANVAALNPNLGYNELASMQANIAAMNNQAGLQYSQLATNTMLRGNAMRNRYLETLARDRQIGPMHSRQNRNALNQGLSQGLMNTYMGREQGIMDNRNAALSARMAARNQQANYNVQSGQRMSNALSTAGYYGSQINWGNNNPGSSAQPLSTPSPQMNTAYPNMLGPSNYQTAPGVTYQNYYNNRNNSGVGLGMSSFGPIGSYQPMNRQGLTPDGDSNINPEWWDE